MQERHATEGEYIKYSTTDTSVIFGDDDLMLNLKNRESDDKVYIDICSDKSGFLVVGTAIGHRYVAQIEIPARQYIEPKSEEDERTPIPFNIDNCVITLFGGSYNE